MHGRSANFKLFRKRTSLTMAPRASLPEVIDSSNVSYTVSDSRCAQRGAQNLEFFP